MAAGKSQNSSGNRSSAKNKTMSKREAGRRGARSSVVRRPPTKGWPLFKHKVRGHWQDLLEVYLVWILLFLAVALWAVVPRRSISADLNVGSIAERTWTAPQDLSVINEAATEALQLEAERGVLPVYDFDRTFEARLSRAMNELFVQGRELIAGGAAQAFAAEQEAAATNPSVSQNEPEPLDHPGSADDAELLPPPAPVDPFTRLSQSVDLKISPEMSELLRDREYATDLEDRLSGSLRRLLSQGVVSGKRLLLEEREQGITVRELPSLRTAKQLDLYSYLDYPDQVRLAVDEDLRTSQGFKPRERKVIGDFLVANVTPNLSYNGSETVALRRLQAAGVGTVSHTVRKGEVIVRKGERVDDLTVRILQQMSGEVDTRRLLLINLGHLLLLAAGLGLLFLGARQEQRMDRGEKRLFSELLLLLTIHVLGCRFGLFLSEAVSNAMAGEPFNSSASYLWATPWAALAISGILLYGRNLTLALTLVGSLLVAQMVGAEAAFQMFLFSLAGSLTAIYVLNQNHFRQRSMMARAGALIGIVNVFIAFAMIMLAGDLNGGLAQLGFDLLCAFLGGLLAAAVTGFAVPIFEGLLDHTTSIKLLELANPNLPLLRRLAFDAPGTFQHSLAVANLAKAGCEAIDRDPLLTHTAALYHDIGKMLRPNYFIENQAHGQNPHDKIQPSMSALILINHIKDGLELAHEHHLPPVIFDAIEQHHGTRLIKFFFNKAKDKCDPETEEIREDDFRYAGPKPQTKEMGILMLADAIEAASRTLAEPSQQKIRGLVKALFTDHLADHQLDHTDLTLGDLRKVEEAFVRVLTNIHHRRIEYPGFDFNRTGKKKAGASSDELPATPATTSSAGSSGGSSGGSESSASLPMQERDHRAG